MHRQPMPLPAGNLRSEVDAPSVALVVGAGGPACAAAAGVQRALQRAGIAVELMVGSSSGAAVAAALALGWEPETTEAVLRKLWVPVVARGSRRHAVLRLALPASSRDGAFSLTDGSALDERIRRAFGTASFDDTRVPLLVITTDLASGERVIVESGSVAEAVRASMAVPMLFPPSTRDGRLLVDGALADPLPVLPAVGRGARVVVALAFDSALPERPASALGMALLAHATAANSVLRLASAYHDLAMSARLLRLEPDVRGMTAPFDGARVSEAVVLGERAMEAQMETLRRLLE